MRPLLLFTIDVEEDMPGWNITNPVSTTNVSALPRLAELCGTLGVKPTYLCNYPVVTQPESARIIRRLNAAGGCEIGTHMHPWNTPPYLGVPGRDGDERKQTYYQSELGPERFVSKLEVLHQAVAEVAGSAPVSFRAGRFGIDSATLRELIPFGYEVDSSVTPLEEHTRDGGPDFRNAPQKPYRPDIEDITREGDLPIVEVPLSVGLTRTFPSFLRQAFVHLPRQMRFRGLLSRDYLKLVDFAWLYPARFDVTLMKAAAATLFATGCPVFNVFIHSNELAAGTSGRGESRASVSVCFERVRAILTHLIEEYDPLPVTLREAGGKLRPRLGLQRAA
jgi:hypothetical protein